MHPNCHFPVQPSLRNINPDKMDVKDNQESHLVGENASPAAETPGKCRKISRTSPSAPGENHEK